MRRRDLKKMDRANSLDHDVWDKISDIKSVNSHHHNDFLDNIEEFKDKNRFDDSIMSEMDQNKDKDADDISVASNSKFHDILTHGENKVSRRQHFPFLQNLNHCLSNFEIMNQPIEYDNSDAKSISSFNSSKLSGHKRKTII